MKPHEAVQLDMLVAARPELADGMQHELATANHEKVQHACRTLNSVPVACGRAQQGTRFACANCLNAAFPQR